MCFIEEKNFIQGYGAFIASTVASIMALCIAIWGWKMRSWFKKPVFKIIAIRKYKQSNVLVVWRILIKNTGNEIAKNVESEILDIYDNNKKRNNFLPSPLRWTHRQDKDGYHSIRNILPEQTAYIDLLDEIDRGSNIDLRIGSVLNLENIKDFSFLEEGLSIIKIGIFCENARAVFLNFKCELLRNEKEVSISLTDK